MGSNPLGRRGDEHGKILPETPFENLVRQYYVNAASQFFNSNLSLSKEIPDHIVDRIKIDYVTATLDRDYHWCLFLSLGKTMWL